jgi:hypothetical protein
VAAKRTAKKALLSCWSKSQVGSEKSQDL